MTSGTRRLDKEVSKKTRLKMMTLIRQKETWSIGQMKSATITSPLFLNLEEEAAKPQISRRPYSFKERRISMAPILKDIFWQKRILLERNRRKTSGFCSVWIDKP